MKLFLILLFLFLIYIFVLAPITLLLVLEEKITWKNLKKVYRILFWHE